MARTEIPLVGTGKRRLSIEVLPSGTTYLELLADATDGMSAKHLMRLDLTTTEREALIHALGGRTVGNPAPEPDQTLGPDPEAT